MTVSNPEIVDRLFYCDKLNAKLLPETCAKMQSYAKDPPRTNPLSSFGFKIDYSKCLNCKQGSINSGIEVVIPEQIKKKRGRQPKPYLCKKCGETEPKKFEKNQKSLCMICRAIQKVARRKAKKDNPDGEE